MKKIFLILFILLSSFLFFSPGINAQESSFLVPGVNCGMAGDIKTNKCCAPVKINFLEPPDFGSPWRVLRDLLLGPGMNFFKTFTNPLENFQKKILIPCQIGVQSNGINGDPSDINCRCVLDGLTPTPGPLQALSKFCDKQISVGDQANCTTCIGGGGVWTGLGCMQGSLDQSIGKTVFGFGIGLAGGFSLLCIIYAAFMMQSSQGNPEKLKKAQEMITSCIMGLMLIIFSVFILRLIGVNILKIPGFG